MMKATLQAPQSLDLLHAVEDECYP